MSTPPPELDSLEEHPMTPKSFLKVLTANYLENPEAAQKARIASVVFGKKPNTGREFLEFEHEYLLVTVKHDECPGWYIRFLIHRNGRNENGQLVSPSTSFREQSPSTSPLLPSASSQQQPEAVSSTATLLPSTSSQHFSRPTLSSLQRVSSSSRQRTLTRRVPPSPRISQPRAISAQSLPRSTALPSSSSRPTPAIPSRLTQSSSGPLSVSASPTVSTELASGPLTSKKKLILGPFTPAQAEGLAADEIRPIKCHSRPFGENHRQMTLDVPKERPLYLYELAIFLVSLNACSPAYRLLGTNCYYHARMVFLFLSRRAGYTGQTIEEIGKELGESPEVVGAFGTYFGVQVPVHETLSKIPEEVENNLKPLEEDFLKKITLGAALEKAKEKIKLLERQR